MFDSESKYKTITSMKDPIQLQDTRHCAQLFAQNKFFSF